MFDGHRITLYAVLAYVEETLRYHCTLHIMYAACLVSPVRMVRIIIIFFATNEVIYLNYIHTEGILSLKVRKTVPLFIFCPYFK